MASDIVKSVDTWMSAYSDVYAKSTSTYLVGVIKPARNSSRRLGSAFMGCFPVRRTRPDERGIQESGVLLRISEPCAGGNIDETHWSSMLKLLSNCCRALPSSNLRSSLGSAGLF